MTSLSPIPEEDLHAYIDGALSPERASAVHAYLCENRAAAERVEAYRRDAQAIARIFSRLDAAEITEAEPASPPVAAYRRWIAQPWVTVAAGLALFLAGLLA